MREKEREYLFVLCTLLDVDAVVVGGEVLGDIVSYPSSSSSRIGGKGAEFIIGSCNHDLDVGASHGFDHIRIGIKQFDSRDLVVL